MIIAPHLLSADARLGLIEAFIMREGTDYGVDEVPLATKVAQVEKQLATGEVVIAFDPASESVTLLTRQQAASLSL